MNKLEYNKKYYNIKSNLVYCTEHDDTEYLISFVIPTYKRYVTLQKAIDSVITQNNKYNVRFELVIVDNDPESLTHPLIKEIITLLGDNTKYYINEENIGVFPNHNRGIELAQGKWICILHSDDFLLPDYLDVVVSDMKTFIEADVISHEYELWDKRGSKPLKICRKNAFYRWLKPSNILLGHYSLPGTLTKRDVFYELGGFNQAYNSVADYEFHARVSLKYKILYIRHYPIFVYVWDCNESLNKRVYENWFSSIRKIKSIYIDFAPRFYRMTLKKMVDGFINTEIYKLQYLYKDEAFSREDLRSISKYWGKIYDLYTRLYFSYCKRIQGKKYLVK